MRFFAAILFLSLVSLTTTCGGHSMKEEPFMITASFPIDEGGLGYVLKIDDQGNTELKMETNYEKPEINAIGVYQVSIGRERAQELRRNLNILSKRPLPKSPEVPPGTPMVMVELEESGKTTRRFVNPTTSTPAMCQVADQIKNVGVEALKGPVQTVRMSAGLGQAEVSRSEKLKITIQLEAEGTAEIIINDPLRSPSRSGGFMIRGVRSDIPVKERWPQHSFHKKLTSEYIAKTDVPPTAMKEPGFLNLKPSEKAVYHFEMPIPWASGQYAVRFIFETVDQAGKGLRGTIQSEPAQMKVD